MRKTTEIATGSQLTSPNRLPITVIIPTRNEARHLGRCLEAARCCAQIYVVDSQSTDETVEIAHAFGAKVVQFHYEGGWPKKRQWALDSLDFETEWILLLDADEILTPPLADEIQQVIKHPGFQGYYVFLRLKFLGKALRFGDSGFWKLSLFRRGKGRFECRLRDQNQSMGDIEVHEHVVVDGRTGNLNHSLLHENVESLSRYITKHNEYSNWESRVLGQSMEQNRDLPPSLSGTQAQRRRWLKKWLYRVPGSPVLLFLYRYLFRLGLLDGVPGLIYCAFQSVQMFHTKAKIYELERQAGKPTV
ncbi:MAG: glycosyltransferase family 2 protein [Candidatus Sulfotelmatobacter sp.]